MKFMKTLTWPAGSPPKLIKSSKKDKWDFGSEDKKAQQILKSLERWIVENYGKRCKSKAVGCSNCQMWLMFDLLKTFL